MGRAWTIEVGHSTRAMQGADPQDGVAAALAAGGNVVELSAINEEDLDAAITAACGFARRSFRRVSVHGPVRGRQLVEGELAARLDGLGFPVVLHPQAITEPALWRHLGRRLLIENTDLRSPGGQTPAELRSTFAELPEAGFCLDISHALEVGGSELVLQFADNFASRLAEVHVGCGCGNACEHRLDDEVLDALSRVIERAGRPLPIVIQRPPATQAEALAQVYAVRGALVASVGTRDAA